MKNMMSSLQPGNMVYAGGIWYILVAIEVQHQVERTSLMLVWLSSLGLVLTHNTDVIIPWSTVIT